MVRNSKFESTRISVDTLLHVGRKTPFLFAIMCAVIRLSWLLCSWLPLRLLDSAPKYLLDTFTSSLALAANDDGMEDLPRRREGEGKEQPLK